MTIDIATVDVTWLAAYYELLARIHADLRPPTYVEIGIHTGASLSLACPDTATIGIDPEPAMAPADAARHQIFAMTSDEFFATQDVRRLLGGRDVSLAFVDGLHHFDAVLRDVANLEKVMAPDGVILIHDCLPLDAPTASRERVTDFWTGDVWKVVPILREHRPDLAVAVSDVAPSGLGIVTGLDPRSTVLTERYEEIRAAWLERSYDVVAEREREVLGAAPDAWDRVLGTRSTASA